MFSSSKGFGFFFAVGVPVSVATIYWSATFEFVTSSLKESLWRRRVDTAAIHPHRETLGEAREVQMESSSSASSDSGDSYDTQATTPSTTTACHESDGQTTPDLLRCNEDYDDAIAADKANVWHHLLNHKVSNGALMIVRGKGLRLWDVHGKEYIDSASGGVWTVNVGYGRAEIANAVHNQMLQLNFINSIAANVPAARFAEKLISKMPGMSRVFYSNSGSEANEKAFKMVRLIANQKYGGKKYKILFRERDYHGTTFAALSATGQEQRRHNFGPLAPGFIQVPHCCEYRSQWGQVSDYGIQAANEIEKVILCEGPDTVGALCLEAITSGGGAIIPPAGYWQRVQEICKKYNVLLLIDEVVMGFGRTGKWFGYQHFHIKPDIVTMAKGLASGYAAISCTVTTEQVFNMCHESAMSSEDMQKYGVDLGFFRDVSTFAGCTSGPTAALANMQIIERENLVDNAAYVGAYMNTQLQRLQDKHEIIGDVRGLGLFAGLELVTCRVAKSPVHESQIAAIAADLLELGVMVGKTNRSFHLYNNVLLLAPALIATKNDIDTILSALDLVLARHTAR